MKVRVQEGATAGEEGLARGEEPHSLADVYPPNSMAAPPPPEQCNLGETGGMWFYYSRNQLNLLGGGGTAQARCCSSWLCNGEPILRGEAAHPSHQEGVARAGFAGAGDPQGAGLPQHRGDACSERQTGTLAVLGHPRNLT